ncbi:uncharacterized protein LOC143284040 isoform X2 [Babylonia areolata]|uniref:uncharacterized protein LOC143284040 isoform X2 n=1 Tax=Babylonia areolata TaxID=304850 RepID=UPI003FD67F49
MATGGGFPRLKQSKSETKQRSSNWPHSVSSDKDDSLSLTSFPSDIRINNWDLSDLRPTASADSRRRKKSKGNPEREREQSLSVDSPPHGEPKQRTPSSQSRTRNMPVAQRDALEKLKQKLTYDDENSTDGERNNERSMSRGRRRHANNREMEGASGGAVGGSRPRTNRNNNTESGPDRNQIVGRLVQIQDYIKQATSMMETLQKSGDSGNAEDLAQVGRLISNLQEQEEGYLSLLHSDRIMRGEAAEASNDGQPLEGAAKRDSDSEKSVDLEVESVTSENTENTSSSRPRIEDKLGLGSDEERASDESKDEDTAMDNTLVPDSTLAAAIAARNVAETMNSLTEREEGSGATNLRELSQQRQQLGRMMRESQEQDGPAAASGRELTSLQRQQLMTIMREKQEQLRQLQNRQDQLLRLKTEAERKLKQAQERDNQARAALAEVEAGHAALNEDGAFLDQMAGQLKSNIVGYPESDDDETSNAREADPLTEIRREMNSLMNQFYETQRHERLNTEGSISRAGAGGGGGGGGGGGTRGSGVATSAGSQAIGQQQQQLEDKLQDLQQKKHSMDQLLAQLETLRSQRLQGLNNETSSRQSAALQQSAPPPPPPLQAPTSQQHLPSQSPPASSSATAQSASALPPQLSALDPENDMASMLSSYLVGSVPGMSELLRASGMGGGEEDEEGEGALRGWSTEEGGDTAAMAMSVQEAQEKLTKLQQVRERLNHLRDLVHYYQKLENQPLEEDNRQERPLDLRMPVDESLHQDDVPVTMGQKVTRAPMAPVPIPPEAAAASAPSEEQSDEENASASEDWGSGMGAWDQDPEVQGKIQKLLKAKDKLRDLQSFIASIDGELAMEAPQGRAGPLTTHTAQARGVEGAMAAVDRIAEGGTASVSEGEVPGLPTVSQGGEVGEEMQQQMNELARLREERERLLALQSQLRSLHKRYETERQVREQGEEQAEGSVRKEEVVQPPSTSVVTFASNDELYSKMRDQRIEREELRSKKKELEAIMKKDQNRRQYFRNQDNHSDTVSYTTGTDAFGASASADATMATWGGSTVDNLENITEDEDAQDGNNRPDDDDDGYPSDGIVQVEEEEEENETDNGTYTIGSDARQRRGPQQQVRGQGARPKTSRGRRGCPQPIKTSSSKKSSKRPQSQPWGRVAREERAQNQQGQRGSLGSVEGGGEGVVMQEFRKQVEKMSSLCQNLMASPTSSTGWSQGNSRSQLATVPPPEAASPVGTVSSSPGEVQAQMLRDMQQQQLMLAVTQCNQQLMLQQCDMAALHRQLQHLMSSMQQGTPPSLLAAPTVPPNPDPRTQPVLMSQPYLSPLSSTLAAHVPNNVSTSVNVQSSRQTTFTVNPNFTSNPFSAAAAAADPQRFPVSQAVQTSSGEQLGEAKPQGEVEEGGPGSSFPRPIRLWEASRASEDRARNSQPSDAAPKLNLQSFLKARRKKSSRKHSSDKSPQISTDYGERRGPYRAGVGGTGFNDAASMSSVSSQTEGAVGGQAVPTQVGGGELNLFEELRETIYTEVATLISHNESRPQYLLSLFSELQAMTSDLMRQRTLFALREIVQTTLKSDGDQDNGQEAWQPWKTTQDTVTAELTPSESMLTSDDEEVKARVRQHASALERKKQKQRSWGGVRGNSLKNDKFDYAEPAVTTSSLSTPTNDVGESPFSRDSLGDTVIHLDKALDKMKRELQQAEQERAERAQKAAAMEAGQDMGAEGGLGDQGSESSVSDMPCQYPRINTQELDEQIKGVLSQVMPVIREHLNGVFSPQLLAYIQRLVLSFVRQPGHTHEFAHFFYGQLASILQNALAKFEGRKVREVGEDVLLDMSEVLFNELAFLRIMRDLDDPAAFEKMRSQPWFGPMSSQRTSAALVGEDYDAGGNESDNEASDDKDEDVVTLQNLKVNGNDEEEEELGKERDDELARKLVTQAADEKDDDTEDTHASSAVHIQLAPSETKPFTRIGSDEDTEGSDASLSLEDPSDTAVSRSSMMEHRQDLALPNTATTTAATNNSSSSSSSNTVTSAAQMTASGGAACDASPQRHKEAVSDREEKEADTSEADGTLEAREPPDGSRGVNASATGECRVVNSDAAAAAAGKEGEGKGGGEVQMNGHASSPEVEVEMAVGIDDLPSILNVADAEVLDQKRQEEEAATSGVGAILASMDTGEELAGDGSALREPDSAGK